MSLKSRKIKRLKTLQNKLLKTLQNKLLNQKNITTYITLSNYKKPISKIINTYLNRLVILSLILLSNLALSQTLTEQDSSKPTVCTITINSTDEKEVFQNHLKDNFNFVELTTLGEEYASKKENFSEEAWFLGACQSRVQCDILVISGHFGGSFFGSSEYSLSLTELQRRSCQEICSGILKKPKEVFLFGCNTTAGKQIDHRTPEEYTQVLIEDGFSRRQAEQISAFRYSPIGEETQNRMKQVFPYSRIYGFHSLAPSGQKIRPRLNKYFNSISNYISHLSSFPKKEENLFWSKAMKGQYIRSVDGVEDIENPICILDKPEPLYKKLLWINEVLSDEERSLSYIPIIEHYFKDLERNFGKDWEDFPREEQSFLERIQFNHQGKAIVDEMLSQAISGIVSAQVTILRFGKKIGWYDKDAYSEKLKFLIEDMFKENLDLDQKDMICSWRVEIDLRLEDLPEERWNESTISVLGCVKPSDTRIHEKLLRILQDKSDDISLRKWAARALGQQNSLNPDVISDFRTILKDNSEDISLRMWVVGALEQQNSFNPDMISDLITILKDNSDDISLRKRVAITLEQQNSFNPGMISDFRTILKDKSEGISLREWAVWALEQQNSLNPDVISDFRTILKDKSEGISLRVRVARALEQQNSLNPDVISDLITFLSDLITILKNKSEDIFLRVSVARALGQQNSLNPNVISDLITILKNKSEDISLRVSVAWILGRQNSLNPDVISDLTNILLNNSEGIDIQSAVVFTLKKQNSLNPNVISDLITFLQYNSVINFYIQQDLTLSLTRYFTNPLNRSHTIVAIDELKQIASSYPDIAKSILKAISEEEALDEEVRSKATQILQEISNP